jgi:hypothetical protein
MREYTMIIEMGFPDYSFYRSNKKTEPVDMFSKEAKELNAYLRGSVMPNSFKIVELPNNKFHVKYVLKISDVTINVVLEPNQIVQEEFKKQNAKIHMQKRPIVERLLERTFNHLNF